uniref:Uncharacterized protein n=1 Tax=Glossina morsitans morsitans TaxID=37546 RepID=A0A1B0G124_GLOMM
MWCIGGNDDGDGGVGRGGRDGSSGGNGNGGMCVASLTGLLAERLLLRSCTTSIGNIISMSLSLMSLGVLLCAVF